LEETAMNGPERDSRGEIGGLLFVDMRLIDGTDLRTMLKRFGPLTPVRAVAIIRQVASALDAAHESGVMHRDVKPENILITRDEFAYLADLGIANAATDDKLTEPGTAVGTYAYLAPERFTDDEVTYRADIYALACVLHECLTGSQIARGMAKRPGDRFASAGDLALAAHDALTVPDQDKSDTRLERSQLATVPGTAVPNAAFHPPYQPAWTPPQQPPNKSKVWIPIAAVGGLLFLILGALGIWLIVKPGSSSTPAAPTTSETTTTQRTTTSALANTYTRRLLNMLPPGYSGSACEPVDPPVTDALATADCSKSSLPGGPASSRYSLFADIDTLNAHFEAGIKEDSELLQCPGSGIASPTTWHYDATPNLSAGKVACGTYKGNGDIVWTKESDLLLGDAEAAKLDDVHDWWLKNG
jgi:serine/threonine kinase PknH